jgi:hypothetical protein
MSNDHGSQPPIGGHQGVDRVHPDSIPGVSSSISAGRRGAVTGKWVNLWEDIFCEENLFAAVERVQANKGAAGVDGMSVDELGSLVLSGATPEK